MDISYTQPSNIHDTEIEHSYPLIDPEEIKHLLESYRKKLNDTYNGSEEYQKNLQQLEDTAIDNIEDSNQSQFELYKRKYEMINQQLIYYRGSIQSVYPKIITILEKYLQFQQLHREQLVNLKHDLQKKATLIANSQEQIEYLKMKIVKDSRSAEVIFNENQSLKEKIQELELSYNQIEKQINCSIHSTRENDQHLKQLSENNSNLSRQLMISKQKRSQVEENIIILTKKNISLVEDIEKLKEKIQYIDKKKEEAIRQIEEKDCIINEMYEQIDELRNTFRNPFERMEYQRKYGNEEKENLRKYSDESEIQKELHRIQDRKQQKVCLTDDIPKGFNIDIDTSAFNNSFMGKLSEMELKLDRKEKKNTQAEEWEESFIQGKPDQRQMDLIFDNKLSKSILDNNPETLSMANKQSELKKIQSRNEKVQRTQSFDSIKRDLSIQHLQIANNSYLNNQKCLTKRNRVIRKPSTTPYKKMPVTIDLYYSHFILISQSIKMRENCQKMLQIDVKPLYKEAVDRLVPMHEWQEWIKQKMRGIASQIIRSQSKSSKRSFWR